MKNKQTRMRKFVFLGLGASLALLLSYVEFLLPPIYAAVPGVKVGLPNIVILYVLHFMGIGPAALVSAVRLCISSMLFGNAMTFAYSAAGAVLSLAVMYFLKKSDIFSSLGVSVAGAVSHNLGQILVALVLLNTPQIAFYMIVLTVTGSLSGVFVGLCGILLIKRIQINKLFKF